MIIHHYIELKRLVEELEKDLSKFTYKNNRKAGVRARKKLSEIKRSSLKLREIIQYKRYQIDAEKAAKLNEKS
jgi:hypothetical protein